jgi:hypothetical protein
MTFVVKKTTAPTDSHMVSHCSTSAALPSLALEVGRDPVFSRRYGRSWQKPKIAPYKLHTGAVVFEISTTDFVDVIS